MDEILVSISCITYNHEDYISDAIESFLMQKTNFKFEVIIHDDASTDKTANIIRKYAKEYPEIIKPILQTENQYSKHVKIINTYVLPRTTGKYIALCEGDDYWTDQYKLQKQVDYLEKNPECTMCFHSAEIVDADGKSTGKLVKPYNEDCIAPIKDIILEGGLFVATNSILYPKKLMDNPPEFFNNTSVGDYPLQMFLSSKGYSYYIDQIMSAYRTGVKGSWTTCMNSGEDAEEKMIKHHEEIIHLFEDFDEYCDSKYSNIIDKAKLLREFEILIIKKNIRALKNPKFRECYYALAIRKRIQLNIENYFPKLYKKISNFRKKINQIT
ncbi:glycosyltransferase [Clostridium botulinum]|uniref:glycosyltransferase n=1 Tax=Clostridium botulinum TaxID=1491 RepID=UPI0019671E3A|nr:glycosyltransferase [Clostridium botulinum]MBN1060029.1 glycosyltransferase [Clostridium botulinum]MBN1063175.1 glycosyltransferase [Clostridium botulinum]